MRHENQRNESPLQLIYYIHARFCEVEQMLTRANIYHIYGNKSSSVNLSPCDTLLRSGDLTVITVHSCKTCANSLYRTNEHEFTK